MDSLFKDMALLRRLNSLFLELGREGQVPFAWDSWGWEAVVAGALAGLEAKDWVSPDLQAWGAAALRGADLGASLRALPSVPGHEPGRVLPVPAQAGCRVQQALGVAWASRREGALTACFLGPTELERLETWDAMKRAQTLELPILFIVLGEFEGDYELDASDSIAVLEQVRELGGRVRKDCMPAALSCGRGADPLSRFEELALLPARRRQELRAEARELVSRAARDVLGEAKSAWILRALDERDMEERQQ